MGRVISITFLIVVYLYRWSGVPRLLPQTWTADSIVQLDAVITEIPYQSGSKYIMKVGKHTIVSSRILVLSWVSECG